MTSLFRRKEQERGSVLVELTMVLLPLMLIVMGMVEIGGAWRDKSTAIQASRQAARVSVSANTATTDSVDRDALRALLASFPSGASGGSTITVRKVIIFDASGTPAAAAANRDACMNIGELGVADKDLPTGATNGGSNCNVYLAGNNGTGTDNRASLDLVEINGPTPADPALTDWFNGGGSDWDATFPGATRNNTAGSSGYVGVYVEAFRPWITGFFPGDGIIVSGETIMRIEPPPL